MGLSGCGDEAPAPAARQTSAGPLGDEAVSVVDGVVIRVADVEHALRTGARGRSAAEALRELEAEALLAAEAERLGFGRLRAVRRGARQALVQALLGTIEQSHPPSAITEAELRAAYEGAGERFVVPERRRADHLLVRVEDAGRAREARRVASALLAEAGEGADVLAQVEAETEPARDGFPLLAERLPEVARDGSLEQPFEAALFDAPAEGLVGAPVQTSYGWHLVWVRSITPRQVRTFEAVRDELREELTNRRRFEALVRLLEELSGSLGVTRDDTNVAAAMRLEITP